MNFFFSESPCTLREKKKENASSRFFQSTLYSIALHAHNPLPRETFLDYCSNFFRVDDFFFLFTRNENFPIDFASSRPTPVVFFFLFSLRVRFFSRLSISLLLPLSLSYKSICKRNSPLFPFFWKENRAVVCETPFPGEYTFQYGRR